MSETESEFERSERDFYDPTHVFQGELHGRSETRETNLTEFPFRPAPDISVKCEKCHSFVRLINLKDHRRYHKALTLLRYGNDEPKSSDLLLKRRNFILRKLKASATKEKPLFPDQINEINEAYEYLKSIIDGNFEECKQLIEDVNAQVGAVALNCSPECVYAVGIASSGNERWKSYMEDARTFQDCFGEDRRKSFFGLYDGYHGRFAAEIAASELHKLLLSEMIKFDPRTKSVMGGNVLADPDISMYKWERPDTMQSERVVLYDESVNIIQNIINICETKYDDMVKQSDSVPENSQKNTGESSSEKKKKKIKSPFQEKMSKAFSKAYYLLDILLSYGKDENSRLRWSGCSATTCVIQDTPFDDTIHESPEDNESLLSGLSPGMVPPKTIGNIHLANAGDVHAVLVRGNRAYGLTKDHTPNNKKERSRVLKDGGNLSDSAKECAVNGVILTTRGLGNHGDPVIKKCVLVEPYTTSVPIDQYAQFLVIASRGVWEVFTEKEAASLLIRLLPCNQIPAPGRANSTMRSLLDEMNKDPSSIDNSSQRISFTSRDSPARRKSMDLYGRKRSATLQSVAESHLEDQSHEGANNSENGSVKATKGQVSDESGGQGTSGVNAGKLNVKTGAKLNEGSTPSSGSSRKQKSRKYIDADMQTEMGSRQGDDDSGTDSGNEADVDSYLENISFPGSLSRISMLDGPPSKEQLQRNQAQYMAQHLVQAALLAGAKDNVTAMVILLPGCGL